MNESRTNNGRIDSRELRSNGDTGNTAAIRGNTAIIKKRRTQLSLESVDRLIFLHGLMSQTASSELLLNCTTTMTIDVVFRIAFACVCYVLCVCICSGDLRQRL